MMQGPIRRLERHHVLTRTEARLPTAWIGRAINNHTWTDGVWLTRTQGHTVLTGNAPVLVMLGQGGEDILAALLAHLGPSARVYALVGPVWGKNPADNQWLQVPRLLVRRISEVPTSACHCGTEARLWIGGGFVLRLDPTQAEALRQTFLRLF